MGLKFLTGPAGSGKSICLQDLIIKNAMENPKKKYFFIVPDQFTMQTQMDIVKRHPNRGIMNIDVLSFGRLSYRVFEETGQPEYPVLDDTGKNLVLRHVAENIKKEMPYIGNNLKKQGYIHEVKSQISEFMQYGLSVEDVKKLAEETDNNLLKIKLRDLALLYEEFNKYNGNHFITKEETLDYLCKKIKESELLKDSVVVFDGFTGFTPIQERVIKELLLTAETVYITLELSGRETLDLAGKESSLFYLSRKTAGRLTAMCQSNGIEVMEPMNITMGANNRFGDKADLLFLEKNLFRNEGDTFKEKTDHIYLTEAKNPIEEIRDVALKVDALVRQGYAYRDIAIITGDLNTYGDLFESFFKSVDLPAYIDRNMPIVLNPFIEYIQSAMEIIIKDYSYDSVFHFLRSGFSEFTEDRVDSFDKYISSLNIRGKSRYVRPFNRYNRGLRDKDKALLDASLQDDLRKQLVETVSVIDKPFENCSGLVKNLYEFILNNHSYEKLMALAHKFEEENNLAKAREYKQIYRLVMELLDQINDLIGDEKISLKDFYDIFRAGITEIQVGTLPESVDRLVVGDLQRTRLKDIKVLFFTGMNDGFVPKLSSKAGILTERDKTELKERGVELSGTSVENIYTQRLYLYMYLCKPSDLLYISYSTGDIEGKSVKPSYVCEDLRKMFPGLNCSRVSFGYNGDNLINIKDSFAIYAKNLRDVLDSSEDDVDYEKLQFVNALGNYYKSQNEALKTTIDSTATYSYEDVPLSGELVKALYGSLIEASVSRMEQFARCAYAHYLKYGMHLEEDKDFSFNMADYGTVCHGILELFSNKLIANNLSLRDFPDELGASLINECVDEYAENFEQGMLSEEADKEARIRKIKKIMKVTVDTLKFQLNKGEFTPHKFEYSFKRQLNIDNPAYKAKLIGKIDRIDVYETDDRVYVKVLDYKSSSKDIDVTEVYYGLQQQLFTYLKEAVQEEKEAHPDKDIFPSGLFYYDIEDPVIKEEKPLTDEELDEEIKKEHKLKGLVEESDENILVNDRDILIKSQVLPVKYTSKGLSAGKHASREEIMKMADFVTAKTGEFTEKMLKGDKNVSPIKFGDKDSCTYCAYKSICKFDEKIDGYNMRSTKDITKDEAMEQIMGGAENGD